MTARPSARAAAAAPPPTAVPKPVGPCSTVTRVTVGSAAATIWTAPSQYVRAGARTLTTFDAAGTRAPPWFHTRRSLAAATIAVGRLP